MCALHVYEVMGLKSPVCERIENRQKMRVNKILDDGNCGLVRVRGKEAYVKVASLRTETLYKVGTMGELAQHNETLCSVVKIKSEVALRKFIHLPREVSITCVWGFNPPINRSGCVSNAVIVYREVSSDHSKLGAENGELKQDSFKLRNPSITLNEGSNLRSGNNRRSL